MLDLIDTLRPSEAPEATDARHVRGIISPLDFTTNPRLANASLRRWSRTNKQPAGKREAAVIARRERILSILKSGKRMTTEEIRLRLRIARTSARGDLREMRESGIVKCDPPASAVSIGQSERVYFL